jgi:hypothetical protein
MKLKFNGNSLIEDPRGEAVIFGNKAGKVISIIYPPGDSILVGVNGFDGNYYEWDAREVEKFTAENLLE